jgi:hypothetical protein
LGLLGTVRSASALTFAGILAGVLFVAAALALAVVLTLAGVLGEVLVIGCNHDTGEWGGTGSRFGVSGYRLSVETDGSAAEKASEGRGEDKVLYIVALHEISFLQLGIGSMPWNWLVLMPIARKSPSNLHQFPFRAACLKLKEADGYILSRFSQNAVVVAPTIAPWWGS